MTILINFAKSVNLRPKLSTLLIFILLTLCFWWLSVNFISPIDKLDDDRGNFPRNSNLMAKKASHYGNEKNGLIFSKSTVESSVNLDLEYEELECKFARLDPWDPSILQYVYHPRSIECPQRQYNLTYISYNGTLNLNTTQLDLYLKNHDLKLEDINCTYSTYDRHPTAHDDRKSHYYQDGYISPHRPVILDTEIVETKCELKKNRSEIYFNIHAHPLMQKPNRTFAKHGASETKEDQLSVLMLMLDSTSVSVLKRHLIKTYDYIKNVMKFKIFNGFSKVGDNSFPNMIAALTGLV
uniref:Uncharacterized protein n=1 Tax=Romanomermis culicivorax TaxID=13658 RepID=A0A915IEU3_ROMCU